jgi:hypothetical protein
VTQNRSRLLTVLLALTAILFACGPGDHAGPVPGEATSAGSSPVSPPASGSTPPAAEGEITIEQRTVHLDALDDSEADRQALVDYMIAAPEFEDAGLGEDGSAWGRFIDGRLVIFPHQAPATDQGLARGGPRLAGANGAAAPAPRPSTLRDPQTLRVAALPGAPLTGIQSGEAQAGSQGGELPASKRAVVLSTLTAWDQEEFQLMDMLMDKGYQVQRVPAYVEGLKKQVQGVGVFFFHTHGGVAYTVDEREVYGLVTKELRTPEGDTTHEEDLEDYRLAYALVGEDSEDRWYYAITSDFVREYMRFSRHSFVFIEGCGTFNNTMHDAFTFAKASVYAGWTATVRPPCTIDAILTVFDLLLGTNDYYLEDPPFRPFDYVSVWQHLQETGWDTCDGARLMVKELVSDDDFALLAPSIKYMEVNEGTRQPAFKDVGDGELTLHGIFGSHPGDDGRVTINEQPLEIRSWEKDKIVVRLPEATDPDGAGDVMVTVQGHDSNKAPLTRWQAEFNYAAEMLGVGCTDPNDQHQDFVFDVVIRADIHPYREQPGDTAQEPDSVSYSVANTSKAEWMFGGACRCCEWTGRDGTEYYTLTEWGGGGEWDVYTTDNTSGFQIYGQIDASKRTMDFTLWYMTSDLNFWNDRGASLRTTITELGPDPIELQAYDFLTPLSLASLDSPITLQLGEWYGIEGRALSLDPYNNIGDIIYGTFEWGDMPPDFPPDEETPG